MVQENLSEIGLDRLAALTDALEREVPSIRGSFPDFTMLGAQLAAAGGRRSTYVLGTIKSGKSTALSALIAADVLPRGSGVKTFNISRVHHAVDGVRAATVFFKSPSQLAAMLGFDFRMLGMDVQVPADPYDPAALARVDALLGEFERMAQEDGRLEYLGTRGDEQGFLSLALSRVRQTIACLGQLHRDADAALLATIRESSELRYAGDAFENYLRWAGAAEYAVMIQEIIVSLPFPPQLPPEVALVDCQGSDSLNPLDFAAVDAALHRAERIFYVVNSRLGLRLADKDLLLHVQRAGLGDKAALIYNVEAFEPLTAAELERMQAKLGSDLAVMKLGAIPVFTISALLELNKAVRPAEAETIRRIWADRGQPGVLAGVEAGFARLTQHLAEIAADGVAATPGRVLPLLVGKAQTTARALLARDRQMYGLESSDLGEKEVRTAVRRILDGEKAELNKALAKRAFAAFDKSASIQAEIDGFLKAGVGKLLQDHPLPEPLRAATRHGGVMATALEVFNTDWTIFENRLRLTLVNPFIEQGLSAVVDSLDRMYRLMPGVLGGVLGARQGDARAGEPSVAPAHALPGHQQVMAGLRERLERLALATAVPEVLRPIVLLPVIANGLAGEFYARKAYTVLKAKITRKPEAPGAGLPKIVKLWERTLAMALKAAKEDTEFSVSSARENFRFQYFGKIIDALFARFEAVVLESADRYFSDLRRLDAASKLLLSGAERLRVEAYLQAL